MDGVRVNRLCLKETSRGIGVMEYWSIDFWTEENTSGPLRLSCVQKSSITPIFHYSITPLRGRIT